MNDCLLMLFEKEEFMRKRYSQQEKEKYVVLYENGTSVKNLCHNFDLCKSSLYNWIKQFKRIKQTSGEYVTVKTLYELEKRNARLTRENQILKYAGCTNTSPLKKKIEAIISLKDKYNLHVLCDTLEVRRSTVYYHLNKKETLGKFEKENKKIKPRILEIFNKSQQRFGSKKIRVKLIEEGFTVSTGRISKLMKEMNIQCFSKAYPSFQTKAIVNQFTKNHLKQNFNPEAPNMAWVSDITQLNIDKVPYYICVVLDLYSRKILSYQISDTANTDLVKKSFIMAYQIRSVGKELIFHSDQGTQCISNEFQKTLKDFGVIQSLSKPGYPYDNAVAESFFSTFKTEELSRHIYISKKELQISVDEYIKFYNEERPHQSLNYLTPCTAEARYYQIQKKQVN